MTKQHFESFARELAASDNRTPEERMFAARIIIRVAQRFNPRFDTQRFLKASGLGEWS